MFYKILSPHLFIEFLEYSLCDRAKNISFYLIAQAQQVNSIFFLNILLLLVQLHEFSVYVFVHCMRILL